MIRLAYAPVNAMLAQRVAQDLRARGYPLAEDAPLGPEHTLVVLVSAASSTDASVRAAVESAYDAGAHVVAVLVEPVPLPPLLDHLDPLDASGGYSADALAARLDAEAAAHARPLRVRTTAVQRSNRRVGLALVALALAIFAVAVWAIRAGIVGVPQEEYDQVDQAVAGTRDAMIGPTMAYLSTVLPRSTEQAASFRETLQAVPTAVRPFLALTATAIDEQLDRFASEATPPPDATEAP